MLGFLGGIEGFFGVGGGFLLTSSFFFCFLLSLSLIYSSNFFSISFLFLLILLDFLIFLILLFFELSELLLSEFSTSELIKWSDYIISAQSSVIIECIKRNKVVFFLNYLVPKNYGSWIKKYNCVDLIKKNKKGSLNKTPNAVSAPIK